MSLCPVVKNAAFVVVSTLLQPGGWVGCGGGVANALAVRKGKVLGCLCPVMHPPLALTVDHCTLKDVMVLEPVRYGFADVNVKKALFGFF